MTNRRRGWRRWLAPGLVAGAGVALAVVLFIVSQSSERRREQVAHAMTRGDPSRAPPLIARFGCGGCHTISAIPGADGKVAASLDHLRERVYIGGGVLRNTPENLVGWIVAPQAYQPHSAMPRTGINEQEARDVAAFLYSK
jgi:cytochrome c